MVDSNIANQIHGFTIDYGKFILISIRWHPYDDLHYLLICSQKFHSIYISQLLTPHNPKYYLRVVIFVKDITGILLSSEHSLFEPDFLP